MVSVQENETDAGLSMRCIYDYESRNSDEAGEKSTHSGSSHPINSVNAKNLSHRMFRYMHGVLNEVYLQNFLHRWVVNRETNLMMLINP